MDIVEPEGEVCASVALHEKTPTIAPRIPTSQACDGCRNRKIRCEQYSSRGSETISSGSQAVVCKRCTKFGIECTFLRPVKSRGPQPGIKGHATQRASTCASNQRESRTARTSRDSILHSDKSHSPIESADVQESPNLVCQNVSSARISQGEFYPTPEPHFAGVATMSQIHPTDIVGDREHIRLILADYLQFLYPLVPIIHRPTFHRDMEHKRDCSDDVFLGLIYAVCAATIATLPSRFETYRHFSRTTTYVDRKSMIYACYSEIMRLRAYDYFDKITHFKWATHYLMYIAFFHVTDYNRSRMLEVEANQLARLLNLHKISEYEGLNHIETQLRKKAFWLTFYGFVHGQLQFLRKERLGFLDQADACRVPYEALMPAEVDDEYIQEHTIQPQPTSTVSLVTGFNLASLVFLTAYTSQDIDEPCPCARVQDLQLQIQHVHRRLNDLKYMLDDIPSVLQPWAAVGNQEQSIIGEESHSQRESNGQLTSLRVNLHITHIWFCNLLSTQLDELLRSQSLEGRIIVPIRNAQIAWLEYEDLCRQSLSLLRGVPIIYIEPNGQAIVRSFTHLLSCQAGSVEYTDQQSQVSKIRDIAVNLLSVPSVLDDSVVRRASIYLRAFADILSKLDVGGYSGVVSLQSWIDGDRAEAF